MYFKDLLYSGSSIICIMTFKNEDVVLPLVSQHIKSPLTMPQDDLEQLIVEDIDSNESFEEIPMRRP